MRRGILTQPEKIQTMFCIRERVASMPLAHVYYLSCCIFAAAVPDSNEKVRPHDLHTLQVKHVS